MESNSTTVATPALDTIPAQDKTFVCNLCSITFTRKDNLRKHEKNRHNICYAKCNNICALCHEKCRTIPDLHNHIQIKHNDVNLCFEEKVFYCETDFKKWKAEFERSTVSSFILQNSKDKGTSKVRYFKCHRSGMAKDNTQGVKKKQSKHTGSIKTGITCPAIMKVHEEDSTIIVMYQSTHIGHKCEVGKLPLKPEDRSNLAKMLSDGLPISTIIEKTQAQFSPTKRMGLITRQDIYNVARDFKVNRNVLKDDTMVVDTMATETRNSEKNTVLKQIRRTPKEDVEEKRRAIETLWQSISLKVKSTKSCRSLNYVEENLKNIQAYLDLTKTSPQQKLKTSVSAPSYKNVSPERKFKTPKQKNKIKPVSNCAVSSEEEHQ